MVENNENVICQCNMEKAQVAVFGQVGGGQFTTSEPLVIRPNWFKRIKHKITKNKFFNQLTTEKR